MNVGVFGDDQSSKLHGVRSKQQPQANMSPTHAAPKAFSQRAVLGETAAARSPAGPAVHENCTEETALGRLVR